MMHRETVEHYRWMMSIGYRPNFVDIMDILASHLEALAEIERLKQVWCAFDCDRCHDPEDCDPDCPRCRDDPEGD
jgi:hypothetical protein